MYLPWLLALLATDTHTFALPSLSFESQALQLVPEPDLSTFSFTDPNPSPYQRHLSSPAPEPSTWTQSSPLPVILWHGLGDQSDNPGLRDVADLISEIHPGTYVHIISATTSPDDRSASFFGNVTEQVQFVCETLAKDKILSTAPAVDAIGFSQGGQFLRGYVERCTHWAPKVRNLITFGSQHNGIAEFQKCKSPTDLVCRGANALLRGNVWSEYVQGHVVPAQYYRSMESEEEYERYLEYSGFLADVNNERASKNETYKKNLNRLEKFVMVLFKDDATVLPKESGWFAEVNATSGDVTPLRERTIYKEDWLGLKTLDERSGLMFETVEGEHMQLKEKDLKRLFRKYLGPKEGEKDVRHGDL